ncbi:MAG: AAA family ATPase, partial [Candidatus Hodarchaeota archaeon]
MRIHKLSIQNFRSIPHLKLENLHNLNCFIGAHNSGKTNVLDGISVFWDPFLRARVQQNQLKKESLGQILHQAPPILSYISDSNTILGSFELEVKKSLESWQNNSYLHEVFTKTALLHTQDQSYDFFNEFLE